MAATTSAYSARDLTVVPLKTGTTRRVMNAPRHEWHASLLDSVATLTALSENWNGYGAHAVSFHVANFAMSMIASACPTYVHEPQVVPGIDGDLQIEWHSLEVDIEVHVRAPFDVLAVRIRGDVCEEVILSNDFTQLAGWLEEMETAIAARTAAA